MAQIARSIPAGCKEIFPQRRLGAGPRAARRPLPRQQPALLPPAGAPARDTGNFAGDGTGGPIPSSAKSGPPANAANAGRPRGTAACNTASAGAAAETPARSLLADTGAALAPDKSLAPDAIVSHDQEGPREPLLPKVKSRRQRSIALRDAFYLPASPIAFLPYMLIDASSNCHCDGLLAAIHPRRPSGGLADQIVRSLAATNIHSPNEKLDYLQLLNHQQIYG